MSIQSDDWWSYIANNFVVDEPKDLLDDDARDAWYREHVIEERFFFKTIVESINTVHI